MSMFSKNLHKALSCKAIKQVDFANAIKVPPTTLSGWLRGAHEPSIDMLLTVCNYLSIPVGEMLGDKNSYVNTGAQNTRYEAEIKDLHRMLDKMAEENAKYKTRSFDLERKLEEAERSGNKYRSMIETLKEDGAKEITLKF